MGSTQSTWGQGSVEQESKRYKLCVRKKRKVHGRLKASWKISCLAVNGQSFLVIDGYLFSDFFRMSYFEPRFLSFGAWGAIMPVKSLRLAAYAFQACSFNSMACTDILPVHT